MTIRPATLADVPVLVAMGRHQVAALYGDRIAENVAQLTALTERLVTGADSVMFIVERDGRAIGMIGMVLFDHHISGARTAGEVAWWLEPDARGGGLQLLKRAERWAAERGAAMLQMMAPNARVGQLYERRGYSFLESTYLCGVDAAMAGVRVIDDVLPDAEVYRSVALDQPFSPVEPAPGVVFHGIGRADGTLPGWIVKHFPSLQPVMTFIRQSPFGQREPHFIHTDTDMGEWTGIYYLTADPPAEDGTAFWRDKTTGAICGDEQDQAAWDEDRWERWQTVEAQPNRLVLFPANYFHSRAMFDNYGQGDSARLIQVVFGTGQVD